MMKKVASLIMFIFLAMVGYYIGEAVAQNNTAEPAVKQMQNQNVGGVLVMEEYDAVAVPVSAKDAKTAVSNQTDKQANQMKQLNKDNAVAEVIEESVSETETTD
ncbi:MAG: hypothetical protein MR368_01320 [Azospirillum sp.]|nr:hypothetical protein [Azospirillum sp.]